MSKPFELSSNPAKRAVFSNASQRPELRVKRLHTADLAITRIAEPTCWPKPPASSALQLRNGSLPPRPQGSPWACAWCAASAVPPILKFFIGYGR